MRTEHQMVWFEHFQDFSFHIFSLANLTTFVFPFLYYFLKLNSLSLWESQACCQWKGGKQTFLVRPEELQLFLLLPPQGVDNGDGQPQRLLRVAVRPQGVHPGARCGDVLCRGEGSSARKEILIFISPQWTGDSSRVPRCLCPGTAGKGCSRV